jgi:hypothetical protein
MVYLGNVNIEKDSERPFSYGGEYVIHGDQAIR